MFSFFSGKLITDAILRTQTGHDEWPQITCRKHPNQCALDLAVLVQTELSFLFGPVTQDNWGKHEKCEKNVKM